MKKIMAVMLSLLACTVLLAGCNTSSESNEEQSLKVYSFSGENEYISVSNGVIILDGKDEICYGGDLKVMSDDFANITTYSTTIYINGSEKETLLSNGVDDQTGETIDVSGNVGQISGDILRDSDADKLTDNLWFEYSLPCTADRINHSLACSRSGGTSRPKRYSLPKVYCAN